MNLGRQGALFNPVCMVIPSSGSFQLDIPFQEASLTPGAVLGPFFWFPRYHPFITRCLFVSPSSEL